MKVNLNGVLIKAAAWELKVQPLKETVDYRKNLCELSASLHPLRPKNIQSAKKTQG